MSTRRDLLKLLSGMAALGAVASPSPAAHVFSGVVIPGRLEPPLTLEGINRAFAQPDILFWRGKYRFCWTGWKASVENSWLAAQWLAIGGRRCFYSSTPGIADSYKRGYTFDLSWGPEQLVFDHEDLTLLPHELLEKLSKIKLSSYERLVAVMTKQGAL